MFSYKSFTASGLIFRSLIHFEFIFVYGVRECSNFILLHVPVQFSQGFYLSACSTQSFQWMTLREEVSEEEGDIRGVFQAAIFRGI